MHLGADWSGVTGSPPGLAVVTGVVKGDTMLPVYEDYKVVVLQQPHGRRWLDLIKRLQRHGIKVIYEVDDYLHGVRKQGYHDFAAKYSKKVLLDHEMCMRVCDAMICSTEYIARRYAKFNRNVHVCRNGIDLARYAVTRPERSTINIGWAGATGHIEALVEWLNEIFPLLKENQNTCFVSIGQPGLERPVQEALDDEKRAIGVPWAPMECYPAAMCLFDIALAPAQNKTWYRGKSDLRWLEASALEIPIVASRLVYPEIEHGVTGFLADTPQEAHDLVAELIEDEDLRRQVGRQARDYVELHRTSEDAALAWMEVCQAVVGEYESVHRLQLAS